MDWDKIKVFLIILLMVIIFYGIIGLVCFKFYFWLSAQVGG